MAECFELPAELTIYTAAEVRQLLLTWLGEQEAGGTEVAAIGASGVNDIDGAGLQLLGALSQTLAHQAMAWHFRNPSNALIEACQTLGSAAWLLPTSGAGAAA